MNATRKVTMVLKKTFLNFAQMLAMECLSTIPITVRKVEVTDRQLVTLGLTKNTIGNGNTNLKLLVRKNTQVNHILAAEKETGGMRFALVAGKSLEQQLDEWLAEGKDEEVAECPDRLRERPWSNSR